jgi:DNA-binding transcriptional LysR family regulator
VELRHRRYFLVVAQTFNFTRAVQQLNIAQPLLSRQIQPLEDKRGVHLLDGHARCG